VPWALLLRAVARIAAALFVWRLATSRRGAYRGGDGGTAPRTPAPARPSRLRSRTTVAALREGAVLSWRLASLVAFLVAATVLITAGATLSVLTPRWLGGVLLGLAVASLVAAFLEARVVFALLAIRRRRRRNEQLIRNL